LADIDGFEAVLTQSLTIRVILGGIAALFGALVAEWLHIPLPWMLGPLMVVASLKVASAPISGTRPLRHAGQWVIGTSLGLYFTPDIVTLVVRHWGVIVVGTVLPVLLSMFGTWVLWYLGRTSIKTAWFSTAIGGSSEMSNLAERWGARVDLVASAHSLRILVVVIVIPFAYQALGFQGSDLRGLSAGVGSNKEWLLLISVTVTAGFLSQKYDLPNAWVLGPLIVSMLMTAGAYVHLALPSEVIKAGQLLIGWSLGDRYRPGFFKAAPRFLTSVLVYTMGSLLIVAAFGLLVSSFSELSLATIWLGYAPGGLAEMSITAKVLALGVPLVTAMQVSRMALVVVVTGWFYNLFVRRIEARLPHRAE